MADNKIFQEALRNFTFDVASGGAIEHLAANGYVPQQICKMLDFPTPYERVQEAYWKYLLKNKIVVREMQELSGAHERTHYVTEYDAYGRKSFRRVTEFDDTVGVNEYDYVSCDFGVRKYRDAKEYARFLEPLNEHQKLYMEGVPWEVRIVWHRLDADMAQIIQTLREKCGYHGMILRHPTYNIEEKF